MKKHIFLFSFVLLGLSNSLFSQEAFEKYQKDAIYLETWYYIKNGEKYSYGFFGNKLKPEMEVSPNAMAEFKLFEKKRNNAFLWYGLGLGSFIAAYSIDKKRNKLSYSFLLASATTMTVSITLGIKSGNHLKESIRIRNRDILK